MYAGSLRDEPKLPYAGSESEWRMMDGKSGIDTRAAPTHQNWFQNHNSVFRTHILPVDEAVLVEVIVLIY